MIVYSISINVDDSIHEEWLEWITTKHIPDVMETGCFKNGMIFRVLSPEPEEGESYVIEYHCDTLEDLERYQIEHAAILQSEHTDKYEGKFTVFRTVMEKV